MASKAWASLASFLSLLAWLEAWTSRLQMESDGCMGWIPDHGSVPTGP